MATATAKTTTITLDRPRTARMDFNALEEIETLTGANPLDGDFWSDMPPSRIKATLYACLKDDDSALELREVGRHLHPGNLAAVAQKLFELFSDSIPEVEEAGEGGSDIGPLGVAASAEIAG